MIRYQVLDRCFRNPGRKYFMDDLVVACNDALYDYSGGESSVKKRQIFDDIKFMESSQGWNIPLIKLKEGRKVYYRYENLEFSINSQPLNEREEIQLREALTTLSRFKGMPQFEWMDELTAKLEQGLGLSKSQKTIMEFEQNQYLKGLEHITPIYEAIQNKKTLQIEYQPFNQEQPQELVISPYYLKQYNNRWFLFGTTEGFDNLTNLALDRIESIKFSNRIYQNNDKIDFSEYFEDLIGVSFNQDKSAELIELKLDPSLLPYIKTKPIHGSQKYTNIDGDDIIKLWLIPNYELESLLLSFGEKVEIVKPIGLRNKIVSRISEMNKKYNQCR